jgi:hypothetical protein
MIKIKYEIIYVTLQTHDVSSFHSQSCSDRIITLYTFKSNYLGSIFNWNILFARDSM